MSVSKLKVKPYEETVLKNHISVSFSIGKYADNTKMHDNVSYRAFFPAAFCRYIYLNSS